MFEVEEDHYAWVLLGVIYVTCCLLDAASYLINYLSIDNNRYHELRHTSYRSRQTNRM